MTGHRPGPLGALAAGRPRLVLTVMTIGLATLCVLGVRNSGDAAAARQVGAIVALVLGVMAAPVIFAAIAPKRPRLRIFYAISVIGAIFAATLAAPAALASVAPPIGAVVCGALVFGAWLALGPALAPADGLSVAAIGATVIGAAAAAGFLAGEGALAAQTSGAAIAIALGAAFSVATGLAADFADAFASGRTSRHAAAHAVHRAIAPAAFGMLVLAAYLIVITHRTNFGAVDWAAVWNGITAMSAIIVAAIVGGGALLARARISEQVAAEENLRRRWFAAAWRPLRRAAPVSTAGAVVAIAAIIGVIALFETPARTPGLLAGFTALCVVAAGVCFVSLRTMLLLAILLTAGAVAADYATAALGLPTASDTARFAALSLAAFAGAQLTMSWRDAGDIWRNARDVAENAMSDGLRRYLAGVVGGGVGLYLSSQAGLWREGEIAAVYFLLAASFGLALAPFAMIALSVRLRRY